ncbi:hypothetical protein Dsin_022506 [Dipteronia sinensis]|uniref:Uncharacterized protein n=1 Tax=Dipteronia sinensis TaxID=43782 RepID=A0AAE0E001_9ROSI|nr:hypothetical protein Dsin_022506 [Dipteronia sinensis]
MLSVQDNPYDKDDDVIKATSFEVTSTLRDVLKTSSLWRDHVQTYTQHIGDFSFPRLADFGAAISGGNKVQFQAVLEELDETVRGLRVSVSHRNVHGSFCSIRVYGGMHGIMEHIGDSR